MQPDRRSFLAGTVASAAALALPTQATALSPQWLKTLPWVKANRGTYHQVTIRNSLSASKVTFQARFDLKPSTSLDADLFSGVAWSTERFVGLGTYFGTADSTKAQSARNVIDARSPGPRTSIYAVGWGRRSLFMVSSDDIAPDGVSTDGAALCVNDWRYASRVANLDPSAAETGHLDRVLERLPMIRGPYLQSILYMNEDCRRTLGDMPNYRGVPIQTVPISSREERVT